MRIQLHTNSFSKALSLFLSAISVPLLLAALLPGPSRAQDSAASSSVVEAARNARDLRNNAKNPHKVITNEDLKPRLPSPPPPDHRFLDSISYAQQLPPSPSGCETNPQAIRLKSEIQASQSDLDALQQQASLPASVISDRDLDPQYFKPGASGFNVGSAPLLDNQPPIPARVSATQLQERIASLQQLLRIACEPPEAASLQLQVDTAQQQLDLATRALALDQADFYGRTDFTSDSAGQLRINSEQQRVQELQAEFDRLKAELAAQMPAEPAKTSPASL